MSLESTDQKHPEPKRPGNDSSQEAKQPEPPIEPVVAKSNGPPTTAGAHRPCKPERDWHDKVMLGVEVVGVIFLIAYTTVAALQWYAMRDQLSEMGKQQAELIRANDVSIEAQSPLIYVYDVSLLDHVPRRPPEKAIHYEDRIHLRLAPDKISGYVVVEFENFGTRAAIVQGVDIEWRVSDKLPEIPEYSHPRVYSDAIRPSDIPGISPVPHPITDNHYSICLTKDQVEKIKIHHTNLWIYGKVNLNMFAGRFQEIRFCDRWHAELDDAPPEGFSSKDCPPAYIKYQPPSDKGVLILEDWYDEQKKQECQ